jgi:hypothetical protein
MHSAIEDMLSVYNCKTTEDYKNALKEIVQEIALLGLYRSGFYNKAAFYGGTALRIFHGSQRFSEDLDFSLVRPDAEFDLSAYTAFVKEELGSFGLNMTVEEKIKQNRSAVKSAFIKGGTQIHLLKITSVKPPVSGVHPDEQTRIKLEVDTNPPGNAGYEIKYRLTPVPYSVRLFDPGSLFAGKIHAILCRGWKSRVKGRDFYDYLWFLSKGTELNIRHLESRMVQSGHLSENEMLDKDKLMEFLQKRFAAVDFGQAGRDVVPFVKDPASLEIWSEEFFTSVSADSLKIK